MYLCKIINNSVNKEFILCTGSIIHAFFSLLHPHQSLHQHAEANSEQVMSIAGQPASPCFAETAGAPHVLHTVHMTFSRIALFAAEHADDKMASVARYSAAADTPTTCLAVPAEGDCCSICTEV